MKHRQESYDTALDMTPMIDVVFLMIIFFMIVSDMTQQDLAELKLPMAEMAQKDESEKGRLTVNVLRNGDIMIKRRRYRSLDDPGTVNVMRSFLANEVLKGELEEDGTSERPLLLRADKQTEFKHIQKILRICGENGIRIYKIELAASQNEQ